MGDMADIIKMVQNTPVRGAEAQAKVVDFLRRMADDIESGGEPEAHKAMIVLYKDAGEQYAIRTRFCNVTTIERAGMLYMVGHDVLTDG